MSFDQFLLIKIFLKRTMCNRFKISVYSVSTQCNSKLSSYGEINAFWCRHWVKYFSLMHQKQCDLLVKVFTSGSLPSIHFDPLRANFSVFVLPNLYNAGQYFALRMRCLYCSFYVSCYLSDFFLPLLKHRNMLLFKVFFMGREMW